MKTEVQIRRKLKQSAFRHLKKRLEANFRRLPERCRYNFPTTYPNGRTGVRVCCAPLLSLKGVVCDSEMDPNVANDCGSWGPLRKKEAIREEFVALLRGDRDQIAAQGMPDVAALMWVLDQENGMGGAEAQDAADPAQEEGGEDENPPVPEAQETQEKAG